MNAAALAVMVQPRRPTLVLSASSGKRSARHRKTSCERTVPTTPTPRHSARRATLMKAKDTTKKAQTKVIKVDVLSRVEGEGALYVKIKNRTVIDVEFRIFEPPRLFEALLRGRAY